MDHHLVDWGLSAFLLKLKGRWNNFVKYSAVAAVATGALLEFLFLSVFPFSINETLIEAGLGSSSLQVAQAELQQIHIARRRQRLATCNCLECVLHFHAGQQGAGKRILYRSYSHLQGGCLDVDVEMMLCERERGKKRKRNKSLRVRYSRMRSSISRC